LTDRLLSWAIRQKLAVGWRYLIATAITGLVAILRAIYITSLLPWLPFIPAVILLALLLGAPIGFYATLLASLLAAITIAPDHDLRQLNEAQWTASALFVVIMAFMVFIAGELRAAYRRNAALLDDTRRSATLLSQRESELALLNAELGHRLKNQLTVVQALTTRIIRKSSSLEDAERAVSERLSTLARASDLLLGSGDQPPELGELISTVLAPLHIAKERIVCTGGSVKLHREAMLALALSVHELATNALKYGALSVESGHVTIDWGCEEDEDGHACFHFAWRESGGPQVLQPQRRGFGTVLLERALSPYFKGRIASDFRPDGLTFEIDAKVTPGSR
jgi:two-component sensor histidine kinase